MKFQSGGRRHFRMDGFKIDLVCVLRPNNRPSRITGRAGWGGEGGGGMVQQQPVRGPPPGLPDKIL
jgi:hypothetical protein